MSETVLGTGPAGAFHKTHPAADGWRVFQEDCHAKLFSYYLPEFLRTRHPEWIKKMEIMPLISEKTENFAGMTDTGKFSLEEQGWLGAIEITADGREIHYAAHQAAFFNGLFLTDELMILAAAKDTVMLEKVYGELKRFVTDSADARRRIIAVNGPSLPKPDVSWSDIILPENMAEAASRSEGFSMAYVHEIFTNALLLGVSRGEEVNDSHLKTSLAVLKKQFKSSEAKNGLKPAREGG